MYFTFSNCRYTCILLFLSLVKFSNSQIGISTGNLTYTQNFNSLSSTGTGITWTNNSTLTGWYLYNSTGAALTTYIADIGSSTTGSYYSFGAASNSERALGSTASGGTYFGSPASGAVAGYLAVAFTNNTSGAIDSIIIKYDGEQWRNGGNTSTQKLTLEYGFGASFASVTTWNVAGTAFDFTSPVVGATAASVVGNSAGKTANIGGVISSLGWSSGATLWIRWQDLNDVGNDHGLAIDSFQFTAIACVPVNQVITVQPQTQSICEGNNMTLLARGTNTSSFEWRKNGISIVNAVDSILTINNVSLSDSGRYDVILYGTNTCSFKMSDTAKITINAKPSTMVVNSGGNSLNTCINTINTLNVSGGTVSGGSTNIVWSPTNGLFTNSTATNAYASVPNTNPLYAKPIDTISYTITSTSNKGCIRTQTFVLNVTDSTTITTQPVANQKLCSGSPLSLNVTASSTSPINYQWRKNGANITGNASATTNALFINTTNIADSGNYDVLVSTASPCPTISSSMGQVKINQAVSISAQPQNQSLCQGRNLILTTISAGDSLKVWRKLGGSTLSNTDTLRINNIIPSDSGKYFVTYLGYSPCPNKSSDTVNVSVVSSSQVTNPPSSKTICQGVTLSLNATGANATSGVWLKNGIALSNGGNISINNTPNNNSINSALNISNTTLSDSGNYRFVSVGGSGCNNDTSIVAIVKVISPIAINSQPNALYNLCENAPLKISINATNVKAYKWLRGTDSISNKDSVYIPMISIGDTGIYKVLLTAQTPCIDTFSQNVSVKVTPLAKITNLLRDTSFCTGNSITLGITTNGQGDSIVWYKNNVRITNGTIYTIPNTSLVDSGNYRAIAYSKNSCKNDTSNSAKLQIKPAIIINSQPISTQNICLNSSANISIGAGNVQTYQWTKNGNPIANNSNTLTLSNANYSDTGNYSITLIGQSPCPNVQSNPSRLNIIPLAKFSSLPKSDTVCLGNSLSFASSATNADSIVWYKSSRIATGQNYTITNTVITDSGQYRVIAYSKNNCKNDTTQWVRAKINSPASFTTHPVSASMGTGGTLTLTAIGINGSTITWHKNGISTGITGTSITFSPFDSASHSGTYTAKMQNIAPCSGEVTSNAAIVTLSKCPKLSIKQRDTNLCVSNSITFQTTAINTASYQWYLNNSLITGINGSTYTINNLSVNNAGLYKVKFIPANAGCNTNSYEDSFRVNVNYHAKITTQPIGTSACQPSSHTLSIQAENSNSFQWMRDQTILATIPMKSYTVNLSNTSADGRYKVVALSGTNCKNDTSTVITLRKRNPNLLVKLADSTRENLIEQCTDGNWTYYATSQKPDEFLIAINKNSNPITSCLPDIYLNKKIKDTTFVSGGTTYGYIFGKRYFNIELLNTTLSSTFDVRFFYNDTDTAEIKTAYNTRKSATPSGFSFTNPSNNNLSILSATNSLFTANTFNTIQYPLNFTNKVMTNRTYGKMNNVSYVDINGFNSTRNGGSMYMEYSYKNSVNLQDVKSSENLVQIYPNPITDGVLKFDLDIPNYTSFDVTIHDMYGRKLVYQPFMFKSSPCEIDLNNIVSSSTYYLSIQCENVLYKRAFQVIK